jgi:4-diphosphocytidyl-2-C-methyl-D-erythritol kinase
MATARVEPAPAKVNLNLRVLGRRADGYHTLESLVVFATVGDRLEFVPAPATTLDVRGPTAAAAGSLDGNLVLKAARALAARVPDLQGGHFGLSKRLPVAAGLGGGSSDAAAALRLLARTNGLALDDPRVLEAARVTGADVPVCLDPRPRVMRGIGDILSESLDLPRLPAVLVNPGVAVPTKDVFAALRLPSPPPQGGEVSERSEPGGDTLDNWCAFTLSPTLRRKRGSGATEFVAALAANRNDLEAPAVALQPVIADVLLLLRECVGCRLARMSGSGATCFGLFATVRAAEAAARSLRDQYPGWWVRATVLGDGAPAG